MSKWIDLTEGMIICELCSRYYTPESFNAHLSQHSREEIETLRKLSQEALKMTAEEYKKFLRELECEAYRRAKESIEIEERTET